MSGGAIRDRRIDLADIAPDWLRGLQSAVTRGEGRTALLAQTGRAVELADVPAAVVRLAMDRILATGGGVRIDRLCRDLGVSRQHLARRFDEAVGVSPKFFSRVVRLTRVLAGSRTIARGDWAAVALDHGYSDQSHLIADFRELTGSTPTSLVA